MTELITLDPRGTARDLGPNLAPRSVNLDGMVIGLLSNSKPNSEELLRDVAKLLSEHYEIKGIVEANKGTNRTPAPPEMIEDLAARCDAVITATAEWGSCTSCSLHDAVELEKRGIPSTVLVTTPFDSQARAMAVILGLPGYEYAIIDHPMGSLDAEEIMGRAKVALPQVQKQLTA